jgi:hypothetical protein
MKSTISPVIDKLEGKIPKKLKSALDTAFYKGFQFVFEKGSNLIEKTYNKDKIELEHDINNYAIDRKPIPKYFKKIDHQYKQTTLLNSSISILEGGALGVLGIGLPDIPLFLSVVIKTMYEIALSYGFDYSSVEERYYILLLICGAVTNDEEQLEFDKKVNQIGEEIDHNIISDLDFEQQLKQTSGILSDVLLTAKFLQGIPIIGAVGGVVNYTILNRIAKYAGIKYKKRFLHKKLNN